jgi:hypothetical protein
VSVPRSWATRLVSFSGSVYGTILASALIVALSYKKHGDPWLMIAALAVTEGVFSLAHAWSVVLSAGQARGGLPRAGDVARALHHEWPVLQATWPAITALLLAGLGAFSTDTAVDLALGINAAILFLWGMALARLQRIPLGRAIAAGAVTCGLGGALVALKILVH